MREEDGADSFNVTLQSQYAPQFDLPFLVAASYDTALRGRRQHSQAFERAHRSASNSKRMLEHACAEYKGTPKQPPEREREREREREIHDGV